MLPVVLAQYPVLTPASYQQLLKDDAAEFANLLFVAGIKAVAFDMDQCLVAQHSLGKLRRGAAHEAYKANATPDFVATVHKLADDGIKLAVATHSDEIEYGTSHLETHSTTHIMGQELAESVLAAAVPEHYAAALFKARSNRHCTAIIPTNFERDPS